MLTVSRVAGVGTGDGVAVGVDVGVNSGCGVAVFTGTSITTSVGVGGTCVGVGVGSACWQADINIAAVNNATSSIVSIKRILFLKIITESRIRI